MRSDAVVGKCTSKVYHGHRFQPSDSTLASNHDTLHVVIQSDKLSTSIHFPASYGPRKTTQLNHSPFNHLGLMGNTTPQKIRDNDPGVRSALLCQYEGDLSFIEHNTHVHRLRICESIITDISHIRFNTTVRELELPECRVTDVSSLKDNTSLISINLRKNQIVDISSLGDTAIDTLDLRMNDIVDLTPLKTNRTIRYLFLSENKIEDATSLWGNTSLLTIYLQGNPLPRWQRKSLNRMVRYNNHNQWSHMTTLRSLSFEKLQ